MNQLAVITGASSGIGFAFAKLLAAEHYDLVLVARSQGKLKKMKMQLEKRHKVSVGILVKDLSKPHAAKAVFDKLKKKRVDLLINNAGFGEYGFFTETSWKKEEQMIRLNITALTQLSKLFAKKMKRQQSGKILNLASTASFQAGPKMAVYFASKSYVLSFTEAIANELKGTGVTVTALCPGPTATGFQAISHMDQSDLVSKRRELAHPDEVAEYGYAALKKGRMVAVPGFKNKLQIFFQRFLPRRFVVWVLRKMLD